MTTNITPIEAIRQIKEICKKYKYHTNVVMAIDDIATQALVPQESGYIHISKTSKALGRKATREEFEKFKPYYDNLPVTPQKCDVKENVYYKLNDDNFLRITPISNYFKFVQRTDENPYGKTSICGIVLNDEIIGGIEKESINKFFTPIFNLVKQLHSQQKTFTVEEIKEILIKYNGGHYYCYCDECKTQTQCENCDNSPVNSLLAEFEKAVG